MLTLPAGQYLDNVVGNGSNYDEAYFEVSYVRTYATGAALSAAQASATATHSSSGSGSGSGSAAAKQTQTQKTTSDASHPRIAPRGVIAFSLCIGGLVAGSVLSLL